MRSLALFLTVAVGLCVACPGAGAGEAEPKKADARHKAAVAKGLTWLAKQQKEDGSWGDSTRGYPVAMTSLAGMALLMEGSTVQEGKYKVQLQKAVAYLLKQSGPGGLISPGGGASPEAGRYMFGHGYAMLFLASAVGEMDDGLRRKRVLDALERAAGFTRDAQTRRGGWGYVSARDGADFDEGACTLVVLQGVRAAHNAGVRVPAGTLKDAEKYLKAATTDKGGILYSLAVGGEPRPALTAGSLAAACSGTDYNSPEAKKWLGFCRTALVDGRFGRVGHDDFTMYYYAQVRYGLGDDRYARLFPDSKPDERLLWKPYRNGLYEHLISTQSADGSWTGSDWTATSLGPVYSTALRLSVLQLEGNVVPIYQR